MKRFQVVIVALMFGGCAAPLDELTVCEQVALYQQECTGEYLTPPICDEDTERAGEYLLSLSCEQLGQPGSLQGKADGAFCDWFGFGCTSDEPIFSGAACDVDWDCDGSAFCAEGHCFAGVGSPEMDRVLADLTGRDQVGGSPTHLVADNAETWQLRRALDPRSVTSNSEAMILVSRGAAATESVDQFATDAAFCDRVAWEDISLSDRIKALAFRLPEPLM